MNITGIEWCDQTWNPVTGCFHKCPYCYAANIANRFGLAFAPMLGDPGMKGACKYDTEEEGQDSMLELQQPYVDHYGHKNSYPMGFMPTFHKYRLNEPQQIKKPQNIFVCSMADLFGEWVPDEWIQQVFDACKKAPQHRYLFLTKNPSRYIKVCDALPQSDNFWFGSTITKADDSFYFSNRRKSFLSIEPLQGEFSESQTPALINWVIIGAETGNSKNKIIPKREWIENIVNKCEKQKVPVFMKDSLADIWHERLIQEYPWN